MVSFLKLLRYLWRTVELGKIPNARGNREEGRKEASHFPEDNHETLERHLTTYVLVARRHRTYTGICFCYFTVI